MVNTKLDIHICGPTSVFHFDPHPYNLIYQTCRGLRFWASPTLLTSIVSKHGGPNNLRDWSVLIAKLWFVWSPPVEDDGPYWLNGSCQDRIARIVGTWLRRTSLIYFIFWASHCKVSPFRNSTIMWKTQLPYDKRLHNYGKSAFLIGKSTISMAIINSFLYVDQSFTKQPELATATANLCCSKLFICPAILAPWSPLLGWPWIGHELATLIQIFWGYVKICQDSDFFHDPCASRDVQFSHWLMNDFSISYCNVFKWNNIQLSSFTI